MNRKRFNKKKILGFVKTYHSKKRQIERNITDAKLVQVLQEGEYSDRSKHEVIFSLDGYHIYLSHDMETIITVIGPEEKQPSPKVLNKTDGKQLKKDMEYKKNASAAKESKEMSFEDHMNKHYKK